ncbi:MAG: DUF2868 domain-containing protein [Pseudomonadota bacterium]
MSIALRDTAVLDAVITEAVQLVEEAGPLEDAQAMREAAMAHADESSRIDARARHLGLRLGLPQELARGRQWAPWMLLGLVALVVAAGFSLAGGVTGDGDRRINVTIALTSLLGFHLFTLLSWLAGLALPATRLPASFGRLWLALTARVAGGRRGQAPLLLRAATGLLARARLLPWAFGFVSHAIWSLSFAAVLASLLFALAFRNYTLSWETTILDPGFFVEGVRMLGWLPAHFGFPVPDAQTVLSAAPGVAQSPVLPALPAAGQREWALWLTGCIVVYGLLPRVLLMVLCAVVWRVRKPALRPDLAAPYYRRLATRFNAMAPARVVDADPGRMPTAAPPGLALESTQDMLVAVGFELPSDADWPPTALAALASRATAASASVHLQRVDGSAAERRALLDRLANWRPQRVLVVCRAVSSPDRGTERFLRDVLALSGECRLWLHDAGTDADSDASQRWLVWLADTGLGPQRIRAGDTEAILEGWQPR